MSNDQYRKIERSRSSEPALNKPRGISLPLGRDRIFLLNRRGYAALIILFVLGAVVGGYLGSSSLMLDSSGGSGIEAQRSTVDDSKPNVNVRVYAYKSPSEPNETLIQPHAPNHGTTPIPQKNVNARVYAYKTPFDSYGDSNNTSVPNHAASLTHKKAIEIKKAEPSKKDRELNDAMPIEGDVEGVRIAVVIDDLGLNQKRTQQTIGLKAPLTLAFLPYGYNLKKLTASAKAAGHELLVHLPMQPAVQNVDPGPKALTRSMSKNEIQEHLVWNLSQFQGFVGINNHMGSSFSAWDEGMIIVLRELNKRGLFYLDSLTNSDSAAQRVAAAEGIKILMRDVFIDNDAAIARIIDCLARLEAIAHRRGYAIGIGHPYDATMKALSAWLPTLREKGIELVPLSHLNRR